MEQITNEVLTPLATDYTDLHRLNTLRIEVLVSAGAQLQHVNTSTR